MEEHRKNPDPQAFRDAVQHEDPHRWGSLRGDAGTTSTGGDVRNIPSDLHDTHMHTNAPVTPIATGAGRIHEGPDDRLGREAPIVGERTTAIARDARDVEAEPPVERRRFSIGATFLGWSVAAFFTIVFSAIVLAITGGTALTTGATAGADAQTLAWGALAGYVVATLLAYLIGGYAAGRIALWDGLKHGLGIVAWSVLFAILAVLAGTALADQVNLAAYGLANLDVNALTTASIVGIVLTLLAQLVGAALGGRMGERYHDRVHGIDTRERRRTLRGRRAL